MFDDIIVKIIGYDISNSVEETFRFSDKGRTADINDGSEYFYSPVIKDSIVTSQLSGTDKDAIDIVLSNNGDLDSLINYSFKGRLLEVYAYNNNNSYMLWTGKIDSLFVKERTVSLKGKSHFEILENFINEGTFTGNLVTDEYDGDEDLKDKVKPRLIGQVYNIKPILINPAKLIYGFNWDKEGNFAPSGEFNSVRDGGLDLIDNYSSYGELFFVQDFATTLAMDTATAPEAGTYYTCKTDSTIKLGSKPIYDITLDVNSDFYYQQWIEIIAQENVLSSHSVHKNHDYIIGHYFESKTSYKSANEILSDNLDNHIWFDSLGGLNSTVVKDDSETSVVDFIEAGKEFVSEKTVVFDSIERNSHSDAVDKIDLLYKKNHNVQDVNSLAGAVTLEEQELFSKEYRNSIQEKVWGADIFPITNDMELDTSIATESDALIESTRQLDKYSGTDTYGIDYLTVTTKLLRNNQTVILGIVPEYPANQVDFSSTTILVDSTTITADNSNADFTGKTLTLLVGDPVTITYDRFGYSSERGLVYGIKINTRTMMAEYIIQMKRIIV